MLLSATKNMSDAQTIDAMPAALAAAQMLQGQKAALEAVHGALPAIERGADVMAASLRSGNALIYAAAGSSGLMALADACELPGTFGISPDQIQIHMAGGIPTNSHMPGATEDDTAVAEQIATGITESDCMIVLSASGTTPYALAMARAAQQMGATVIAVANAPDTALLTLADIAICVETPVEAIAGSTRLGAGTAQKVALNLMSSLMGVKLGHVYAGLMVNLVADNAKLIQRARGIVMTIAGVSDTQASAALAQSDGDTKSAILVASGVPLDAARALLMTHDGDLGRCFAALKSNQNSK